MKRALKSIKRIICHHSATDNPRHDDIEVIREWHKSRNFNDVGYHFFIRANGEIEKGRPINIVGAHAKGCNRDSIGICLHGEKQFTNEQMISLSSLITHLCGELRISSDEIYRHRDLAPTLCPTYPIENIVETVRVVLGS